MSALLQIGLINAAVATLLACAVALIGRRIRQPALLHALWIIVLVKLVTPPVFEVPVEVPFSLPRVSWIANGFSAARKRVSRSYIESHTGVTKGSADKSPAGQTWEHDRALLSTKTASDAVPNADATPATAAGGMVLLWNWLAIATGWLLAHAVGVMGGVWLTGAAVWFLWQGHTAFKFSQRLALATPASPEMQQQADHLARAMGLIQPPPVMIVRDVISPMLWGVGENTRLLFPVKLLARLDVAARETLIAHELAHFRRGDHWVRAFELFVSGLYWWNPVLWWARREIEIAEEECCDTWVIEQFPTTPRSYAEALLETIDFLSESALALPPAAVGAGHVPFLRRRLTAIMRGVAPKKMTLRAWLAVAAAALCSLPWHPGLTTASTAIPATASVSLANGSLANGSLANGSLANGPVTNTDGQASAPRSHIRDDDPTRFASTASESLKIASHQDSLIQSWTAEMVGNAPAPTPAPPSDQPWATARSANGRYSITRRGGDGVYLHDAMTGQNIDLSDHHILTVAFSPDSSRFATGGTDRVVRLWDSSTGVVLQTFPRHGGSVQAVVFIHEGKELVSASRDGSLTLWNIDLADEMKTLPSRHVPVTSLAVSPDGRWLAVGSGNWMSIDGSVESCHVVVWDLDTLQEHAAFQCELAVGALEFKADNNTLAAGDFRGHVTFWNLAERERIGTTPPRYKDAVAAARFSPDTRALSVVGIDDIYVQPYVDPGPPVPLKLYFDQSASLTPGATRAFANQTPIPPVVERDTATR